MKKLARKSGSKVTNTLKLVHGWQNDGQQKELFYEDSDETLCPAGCGEAESRMHFIQCQAPHLHASHIKRREEFRRVHGKLKTEKVIYERFMRIFISLRMGDAPPSPATHYDSALDMMVQRAWDEQRDIGWDQILKGRISKYWGMAQAMFYSNSPHIRGKQCFSGTLWAVKTVRSLLNFSLDLWNDRCNTMHGEDGEERKRIAHAKITKRVMKLYVRREDVERQYGYVFREGVDSLITRST